MKAPYFPPRVIDAIEHADDAAIEDARRRVANALSELKIARQFLTAPRGKNP